MSVKKYQKMTKIELVKALEEKRNELYDVKFNVRIGREKDYAQIKYLKKEVSQMMSVLSADTETKNKKEESEVKKPKKKMLEKNIGSKQKIDNKPKTKKK
jgi:ribosomal protein L29